MAGPAKNDFVNKQNQTKIKNDSIAAGNQSDGNKTGVSKEAPDYFAKEPADKILSDDEIVLAQKHNLSENSKGKFPLDWIRKVQTHLGISPKELSNDFSFGKSTVLAIAKFQKKNGIEATGILNGTTKVTLEKKFPDLQQKLVGGYAVDNNEILVPHGVSQEVKFDYYRNIIENSGGYFDESQANLLSIRGVVYDEEGNLTQTTSANTFKKGFKELSNPTSNFDDGTKHNRSDYTDRKNTLGTHFGESGQDRKNRGNVTRDDLMVTLWMQDGNKNVKENKGSLNPGGSQNDWGEAHMMDGQYQFRFGKHGSSSKSHVKTIKALEENEKKKINAEVEDDHVKYDALRPDSNVNLIRGRKIEDKSLNNNSVREDAQPGILDPERLAFAEESRNIDLLALTKEMEEITNKIKEGNLSKADKSKLKKRKKEIKNVMKRYNAFTSPGNATNIHIGSKSGALSVGCANVDPKDYVDFITNIKEQNKESKKILFTIIDASKIGMKLVKQTKTNDDGTTENSYKEDHRMLDQMELEDIINQMMMHQMMTMHPHML